MSKYLYVCKTRIIRSFTYKFEVYGNILMQAIIMITTAFFWKAVFGGETFKNGVTTDKMLIYTVMSSALSVMFTTGVEQRIQQSVEKGSIATDMMKPINPFGVFLAEDIGSLIALVFQNLVPILLIGSLIVKPPEICSAAAVPTFTVSLILSMGINWLFAAIFGMWSFTAISMDALFQVKKHLIRLLSGSIIPIWFFPEWLSDILELLPFVYIYQLPLDIYIGSASQEDISRRIIIQLVWFILLAAAFILLSKKSLKKLMVQGG